MLIVAIAILFVLLVIGGIFVAEIGQNLAAASRSKLNQGADALAQAGIRFCDANFTLSLDGADWRPVPSQPIAFNGNGGVTDPDYRWLNAGFTRLYFQGGRALVRIVYDPHADDPRSPYLQIQSVGRSGDLDQGYDPTVFQSNGNAPRQRRELVAFKQIGLTDYLRWMTNKDHRTGSNFLGVPALQNSLDPNVPTEPANNPGLGYVDVSMVLGDPNIYPTLGGATPGIETLPSGQQIVLFGAPMRSGATLQLGGEIHIFESPRGQSPNISPENVLCSGDYILAPNQDVNGDHLITDQDYQVFVNQPLTAAYSASGTPNWVVPSASTSFSTFDGLIRDGRTTPDTMGVTRSIPFLDPPIMDSYVSGSGSLRYRELTRLSGMWNSPSDNTGFYGWGTGAYIDNNSDLQLETQNANGGYSLRADWLNPQANFAQHYWSGPFYRPPGVLIELMGDHAHLTRTDGKSFRKPDGTPLTTGGGNVVDIPFRDIARANYTFPDGSVFTLPALSHDGDDPAPLNQLRDPVPTDYPNDKLSYGVNLVIMAEGNVRVKGVYGAISNTGADHLGRVHLTIVSGGTAYIDGNILKGDGYQTVTPAATTNTIEGASTCAILAKDYVTVNTTMFMAAENQGPSWTQALTNNDLQYIGIPTDTPSYDPIMSFGVNPQTYTYTVNGNPVPFTPEFLFVRHATNTDNAGGGSTAMNLEINPATNVALLPPAQSTTQYRFNNVQSPALFPLFPPETYALGLKYVNLFAPDTSEVNPNFEQRVFPLNGAYNVNNVFIPDFVDVAPFPSLNLLGEGNLFHFQKDTTAEGVLASLTTIVPPSGFSETEDYLMSNAMVAPLDIQIQALLYAQERSFFVIPGYSFNQNPNDTRTNYMLTGSRPIYDAFEVANFNGKTPFPFYNEPMDVKVTIFGAITENYTASAGDQAAWMGRWGYVPVFLGSSSLLVPDQHRANQTPNEITENIVRGLTFTYDPALSLPYQQANDGLLLTTSTTAETTRQQRAVRYNLSTYNATTPHVFQELPSIPKLPVCPGLLYFGPPDSPVVP